MKYVLKINLAVLVIILSACTSAPNNSPENVSVGSPPAKVDVKSGANIIHTSEDNGAVAADDLYFYFSYDDSSSTAAHDLTEFYIENGLLPQKSWGRSYEYLNAETFSHFKLEKVGPFDISMGLYVSEENDIPLSADVKGSTVYSLGVNVSGPELSKEDRPNIVVTLLLDISGSMGSSYALETRSDIKTLLDVAKHGMKTMYSALKNGDVVDVVTFGTEAQNLVVNFKYTGSSKSDWNTTIDSIRTEGSTNLNSGIELAYIAAQKTYNADKSNRVIIITDAYANTGVVNPAVIAANTVINGLEGIHFSGVGVGNAFDEAFLNELTDIGKGGYSAMITPEDGERIFGDKFVRFIDDAVEDVQFRLDYPKTFLHLKADSSAEELSTDKTKVRTINFSYNSQQFFLENFVSAEPTDDKFISLEVSFKNKTGETVIHTLKKSIADIVGEGNTQIKAAAMVSALSNLVAGKLNCEDVLSSLLYTSDTESGVFSKYHKLIDSYCHLSFALDI